MTLAGAVCRSESLDEGGGPLREPRRPLALEAPGGNPVEGTHSLGLREEVVDVPVQSFRLTRVALEPSPQTSWAERAADVDVHAAAKGEAPTRTSDREFL